MAILNIELPDEMIEQADSLFASLGLDTSTAVRMFLAAAIEYDGLPFEVRHETISDELRQAIYESRNGINLYGPYDTAEEAVAAMMED